MKQKKYIAVVTENSSYGGRSSSLEHIFDRLGTSQINDLWNDKEAYFGNTTFYPIPDDFPVKYHNIYLQQYCCNSSGGDYEEYTYGYVYSIER